jgi:toxin HigB-1
MYTVFMIRSWGDRGTKDIWDRLNSKAARSIPSDIWPVIRRKLSVLRNARRLNDLRGPGSSLEALKGNRAGRYSIRVNRQYRITFEYTDGDAYLVRCEDYH